MLGPQDISRDRTFWGARSCVSQLGQTKCAGCGLCLPRVSGDRVIRGFNFQSLFFLSCAKTCCSEHIKSILIILRKYARKEPLSNSAPRTEKKKHPNATRKGDRTSRRELEPEEMHERRRLRPPRATHVYVFKCPQCETIFKMTTSLLSKSNTIERARGALR